VRVFLAKAPSLLRNDMTSPWITWISPTLSNDTTYFATLASPSNSKVGLDTSVTFRWNKIGKAQKYYIEVSTDASSKTLSKNDWNTTDTSKTFGGLLKNQKYYWRVLVKTADGLGPWSNVWSFVTTLTTPYAPQLVPAVPTYDSVNECAERVPAAADPLNFLVNNAGAEDIGVVPRHGALLLLRPFPMFLLSRPFSISVSSG